MYICSANQPLKQTIMGKFEIKSRKNGEFQFNLKATNGEIIGSSQMYANPTTMKNGIASVMKNAPDAKIVDLTEAKAK